METVQPLRAINRMWQFAIQTECMIVKRNSKRSSSPLESSPRPEDKNDMHSSLLPAVQRTEPIWIIVCSKNDPYSTPESFFLVNNGQELSSVIILCINLYSRLQYVSYWLHKKTFRVQKHLECNMDPVFKKVMIESFFAQKSNRIIFCSKDDTYCIRIYFICLALPNILRSRISGRSVDKVQSPIEAKMVRTLVFSIPKLMHLQLLD